jgi:hypothetical protein
MKELTPLDQLHKLILEAESLADDTFTPEEEAEIQRIRSQKRKISVTALGVTRIRLEAAVTYPRYTSLNVCITPKFRGTFKVASESPHFTDLTAELVLSQESSFPWTKGTLDLVIEPIDPPQNADFEIEYSFSGEP